MSDEIVKRSRWGKVAKVATIMVTVLLCIVGIAYSFTDLGAAASKYQENRDAAKQLGLCFTSEDVAKLYAVPDEENGALLLGNVVKSIASLQLSQYKIDKYSDEEVIAAWKSIEPYFSDLQFALAKPHLIFQRKFAPSDFSNKDIGTLSTIIPLMVRRADIAAKHDESQLASDLLFAAAKLSVHLADEPGLSTSRLRSSSTMKIEKELKKLFQNRGRDPNWRKIIERTLIAIDHPYDVRRVLQREHWSSLWAGKILLGDTTEGTLQHLGYNGTPNITLASRFIPRFQAANLSRFHHFYAEAVAGLPNDPNDFVGMAKSMMKADSTIDYSDTSLSFSFLRYAPMSTSESVGSLEIIEPVELESSQRNALFQAMAILKSGAGPSKGLPLPGRYTQDMDGHPLKMDHTKDGWVVYSVGKNGTDEHLLPYNDDFIVRLPK